MEHTHNKPDYITDAPVCDEIRDDVFSARDTDLNSFSDASLPTTGHHVVRIIRWELVPRKEIVRRYQGNVVHTGDYTKEYVSIDMKDTTSRDVYNAKLYPNGVPSFMNNLATQTDGAVMGMKLSELLRYFLQHDLEIWVRWDSQYGVQIDYYDRDERR